MKKILMLLFNPCTNDARVLKEANSLTKAGYQVAIFAWWSEGLPLKEVRDGFVIYRFKLITDRFRKNALIRILKYIELVSKFLFASFKQKINFIHCHDLAPLPIAVMIKYCGIKKRYLIYDAHELETKQHARQSVGYEKCVQFVEKWLIKLFVTRMITVSDSIAQWYQDEYGIRQPNLVLNCPHYQEIAKNDYFREKFNLQAQDKIFLFHGILAKDRGVEIIINAFRGLQDTQYKVIFMGYGNAESIIQTAMKESSNIFLHPMAEQTKFLHYAASADFGIAGIIDQNSPLSYFYSMPNKIFEYLMAGLPVILSDTPEMQKLLAQYHIGEITHFSNVEHLTETILAIANSSSESYTLGINKARHVYCWENQEKILINLYQNTNKQEL